MTGHKAVTRVTARCLAEGCTWVPVHDPERAHAAADKHTRQAGHATVVTETIYPVKDDPS